MAQSIEEFKSYKKSQFKACVHHFSTNPYTSPNGSPPKTTKNASHSTKKAPLAPRYSDSVIFPLFSTISSFKRTNGSVIIYMISRLGMHRFADIIFRITQTFVFDGFVH